MSISFTTILGMVFALGLVCLTGMYAGRKVTSAADFTTGSNMGVPMISGALIGTLVGGASTIGTAQLAYSYGFSAWWFTLGGGIGLAIMALFFAKPMYNGGSKTLPQMLAKEYGKKIATLATILMSVGTFISIVSQLLSGAALLTSITPLSSSMAMVGVILLMGVYVVFGGALGAGMVGILKTILLYVCTVVCGVLSLKLGGGLDAFMEALPQEQYFNMFARGYWKDGGAGMSLVVGVLTTQAYILPVVSARDLKTSRAGAMLGGVLTVMIGIAGTFVGMYMKLKMPDIPSSAAMPQFVIHCVPGFLGGVILATLLIAIIGTGAGLALGISSMVSRDIYKVYFRPNASDKENLRFSRLVIVAVLLGAALFSMGEVGSMILNWSFLSMGLRGAVAFAPLCFALFSPGRVSKNFAAAAMVCGPVLVLIGSFVLPADIDPLFLGMAGAIVICFVGWLMGKKPVQCK